MKSQALAASQPDLSWTVVQALKKVVDKLKTDVTMPTWTLRLPSISRTLLVISISLLFLGAKFGYSDSPKRVNKPVGTSYSWLTNTPRKINTEIEPKKIVEPKLPCAKDIINLTTNWLAQCPELSISFAKMPNGPVDRKVFNIYTGSPEANREAQLYTDELTNVSVEKGSLTLKALNNPTNGYNYTSARISTKDKKDFLYGRLEVEAMLPNNVGAWPAIWMMSTNRKYESLSPDTNFDRYLNDGEIDIAESVGAQPYVVYGIAHSLAHPAGESSDYFSTVTVPDNDVQFHKYGIDWTPNRLSFTLDGVEYFAMDKQPGADYKSWPYDQPFYLILNLAVGGSWGGIDRAQFPPDGVNSAEMPFIMKIRSITYYALKAS